MKNLKITIGLIAIILLSSCVNSAESEAKKLAELQKFSTIGEVYLGMKISDAKGAEKSNKKKDNYKIYELSDREINSLQGNIFLYVKNDKIEIIMFNSSGNWGGATSVASSVFSMLHDERILWIKNAMTYYEIPKWKEKGNLLFYQKDGIVHQCTLEEEEEFLGIQVGWKLNYIITSKNAIEEDYQTKKNNLKF